MSELIEMADALAEHVQTAYPDMSGRREQFDSHMATVRMCIEHLESETPQPAEPVAE